MFVVVITGCSLEKKSGFNRTMQNLTAHYNILFNAKEILRKKQESYAATFIDNYNELLNVYQDTTVKTATPDKDLDAAIVKANTIINVKEQSHYLGDAYLVLGKANFLGGNYFSAVEFFNYVIKSFADRDDLTQDALAWKARSLMYLDQLPESKLALDTAILNVNPKKSITADVYAAKLQYDINTQDYKDAEAIAKLAIQYSNEQGKRLRWTFILGQLQELNGKPGDAFLNYSKVAKSNASFEMAFNASLNRIRIEDAQNGIKTTKTERLLALLKDPNNKEFKDQIYYQVAGIQMAEKNIDNAIKSYKLSVRTSVKNQNQKGLSYLRLAQVNFRYKADYLQSKKYYDSTLITLPINYPGYQAIQKTASNLQLLADRLQIITREDTLQALAKMDEKTRAALIDKMVNDHILQQQADANAAKLNSGVDIAQPGGANVSGSSFYFYNSNAVSRGYSDFKQKWGNRKLEDNWRRSMRASSDITSNNTVGNLSGDPLSPDNTAQTVKTNNTAAAYRRELLRDLPVTPALLAQSNQRVYNALSDIANFYRDVIGDKKEAIAQFELILKRFPDDSNKPAIYYNLYRLYSDVDAGKSEKYKNLLLSNYPETTFAKVIIDPDYVKKLDDKDAMFTQAYDKVFDLYINKKYKDVITAVPQLLNQYPKNRYAAQLAYLKVIAEGHSEKAQPFQDSLQQIIKNYPTDRLIIPLVNQHLGYMNTNHDELATRRIVLADEDPHDIPFTLEPAYKEKTELRHAVKQEYIAKKEEKTPEKKSDIVKAPANPAETPPAINAQVSAGNINLTQKALATQSIANGTIAVPNVVAAVKPDRDSLSGSQQSNKPTLNNNPPGVQANVSQASLAPSIFGMKDSTNYYFVVNVNSGTTNLSSSRFGIGQYNRVMYPGKGIKHQLLAVGADNQLIYVGRFLTLEGVRKYARAIAQFLPEIMKVPKDKYSFFIITQENLNKLADKKTLDSYMDYYQRNY